MKSRLNPLLLSALVGVSATIAPPASAETSGTGAYAFRLHTCNATNAQTDDNVFVTVQAGGQASRFVLNNDDTGQNANTTDTYRFSWPAHFTGGPATLQSIKVEKDGTDAWCVDSVALTYDDREIWRWSSTDDNRSRKMVLGWPGRAGVWLDKAAEMPASFVRFSDLNVRVQPDAVPHELRYLEVKTCSATAARDPGTEGVVLVEFQHDGVIEVVGFGQVFQAAGSATGANFMDRTDSGYNFQTVNDGLLNYAQKLEKVKVSKFFGNDWCMETTAFKHFFSLLDAIPTLDWQTGRHTFPDSIDDRSYTPNYVFDGLGDIERLVSCRRACQTIGGVETCTPGCITRYQGFPLQSGTFNEDLATCAGRAETCNGVDDNCNGDIDEGLTFRTYYRDRDADTFGDRATTRSACSQPSGYVLNSTDCIDTNNAIRPNAAEVCDTVDNNCNGNIDEGVLNVCGRCGPVPTEICDGLDNDCDTLFDEGLEEVVEVCNGRDDNCNGEADEPDEDAVDRNACGWCGPLDPETCDGEDNDCDGHVDNGPDVNACGACGPTPVELCNARDEDCDGLIDEDIYRPISCGYGVCRREGRILCANGSEVEDCTVGVTTGDDSDCNGVDEDCDGSFDEHFLEMDVDCLGTCGVGQIKCEGGVVVNTCSACEDAPH